MNHKRASTLLLAVLAVLLAACASPTPSGPVEVQVTLTDFAVQSSMTEFKVGVPYHFVVTNKGAVNHEIMIMPPVDPSSGMTMAQMDEMALGMIEEDDMPAGATETMDVTFTKPAAAGELEFACHVPGHYEAGMRLPITVTQ
jgi:uncharacterized cupredoxin-like copper-binding protein